MVGATRPGGSDAWQNLAFFNLYLRNGVFRGVVRGGPNDPDPEMGSGIPWRWAVLDEPDGWHDQSPRAWPAVHDRRRYPHHVAAAVTLRAVVVLRRRNAPFQSSGDGAWTAARSDRAARSRARGTAWRPPRRRECRHSRQPRADAAPYGRTPRRLRFCDAAH